MEDGSRLPFFYAVLLLFCAMYFAAAETAFASCSRPRIRLAEERGDARARKTLYVLDHFDEAITAILIGTNIVHVSAAALVTLAVTRRWGLGAVSVSTLITTVVVFFAGEMLPKRIAKKFADKLALLRNQVQKTNEERSAERKAAAERQASVSATEKYTFVLERPCPVCGYDTHVVKCKSRLIAEKTDLDLCIHYKDFNPYLYRVWACEHCGYAADEQKFTRRIPEKTRDKLMGFLQSADLAMPFVEERTSEQAIQYLEMAILFNELADPSPNRRANLYLIMAWIHRYDGNTEKEMAALDKAAELFDLSLESENYPVDKMSDTMATYLTGAIHVMRKDYDKATKHLSRIISNQVLRTSSPKLFEMARDMWQDIKNAKEKG